jgi:transcriptional regulator with XRE-family HTH domain
MSTKKTISNQATRLKKIRLYLGLTREQLGESIGISQYTLRSWENGLKNFTAEGVQRFISSLKENINFSCSFEWLMYGVGISPISHYEEKKYPDPLNDVTIHSSHEKILNEISTFKKLNSSANVIAVSNDIFYPIAEPGDYIGFIPVDVTNLKNHIGKILYFSLDQENFQFGVLQKKRGLFKLICLKNASAADLPIHRIEKIFQFIWLRKNY